MKAHEIVGWTFDGALYCTDHKPSPHAEAPAIPEGHVSDLEVCPIFASDEIEPLDYCDTCLKAWISANPGKNASDERALVFIDQQRAEEWLSERADYLESFTQGYIECALWCGIDSEDGEERLEGDEGDLSEAALTEIIRDCEDFVKHQFEDLADLDAGQSGHDFYLTRNGHGAGFWDRGLGAKGNRLSKASKPYGTQGLFFGDDGKLHTHS